MFSPKIDAIFFICVTVILLFIFVMPGGLIANALGPDAGIITKKSYSPASGVYGFVSGADYKFTIESPNGGWFSVSTISVDPNLYESARIGQWYDSESQEIR